jgi:ATP-dependent Clp protease ATP-binding subunit ClpC
MTSNVGVSDLKQTPYSFGFSSVIGNTPDTQRTEEVLTNALKRHFKPEFLNRIDTVCFFHSLSRENIGQIAGLMLDKFAKTLAEKGIGLDITPSALEYIVDKGYDAEYGARPLRRVIEQNIEDNIAESLISGKLAGRTRIVVDLIDGQIKIV